jgi:hypothetical protein
MLIVEGHDHLLGGDAAQPVARAEADFRVPKP